MSLTLEHRVSVLKGVKSVPENVIQVTLQAQAIVAEAAQKLVTLVRSNSAIPFDVGTMTRAIQELQLAHDLIRQSYEFPLVV